MKYVDKEFLYKFVDTMHSVLSVPSGGKEVGGLDFLIDYNAGGDDVTIATMKYVENNKSVVLYRKSFGSHMDYNAIYSAVYYDLLYMFMFQEDVSYTDSFGTKCYSFSSKTLIRDGLKSVKI